MERERDERVKRLFDEENESIVVLTIRLTPEALSNEGNPAIKLRTCESVSVRPFSYSQRKRSSRKGSRE